MEDQRGNFADETTDMAPGSAMNANTDLRKRRSTRIVQAVPLAVTGVDALGRQFTERTSTLIINCHGCRYQSKHYVLKNMWVTLEIPHPESGHQARNVRGRVAWIQRPRTVRQLFQVALELEQPGNAWGMAFPPEDWFAFAETDPTSAGAAGTPGVTAAGLPGGTPGTDAGPGEHSEGVPAEARVTLDDPELWAALGTDNVRVFPSPVSATDASLQLARQMTRLLNDAKQQIRAAARDAATQAVSAERRTAFEQWEQKFAAARVEVVNEAERAVAKIQREAEEQAKRVTATAEELAEKTRHELPQTVAPQLHELAQGVAAGLAQELSAKLAEESATQRAQFDQHAEGTAENLRALCEQADGAAGRLTAHRESAEAQLQERAESTKKDLEESLRTTLHATLQETLQTTLQASKEALEERARTLEAAGHSLIEKLAENSRMIEEQSRSLHESRQAQEESVRWRAAELTGQGEALQGALTASANRLTELFEAQAKAQETARTLTEEMARAADVGSARVAAIQDQALEVQATFAASWRAHLENEMEAAKARWQELVGAAMQASVAGAVADAVGSAQQDAARGLEERVQELSGQLHEEAAQNLDRLVGERLHAQLDGHVAAMNEAAGRVLSETEQRIAALRDVASQVTAQAAGEGKLRLTELREAAAAVANQTEQSISEAREAVSQAASQAAAQAVGETEQRLAAVREATVAAAQEAEQRVAGVRSSVEEFANAALREKTEQLEPLLWRAGEAIARLEHFSARLDTAQEDSLHGFRAQLDDVLSLHRNELHRRSEALFEEINGRIRNAFEETSQRAAGDFAAQMSATMQPHVTQAEEAVHRLAGGRSLLDAAMTLQQDRIRGFADEAFADSLARFRENLGTVEQVLQDASQAITERGLADLEGKVEGLKHRAIEDVSKSSEWYEKKAQTQIQHATERAVEQAANLLREKAGEVSGTFASEVDHASRNFVGHTQTQMEEVLRDAFERSRALFAEAAETTEAAFTDEIQRTARRELAGFDEEVQRSAAEMRGQLETARVELALRTTAEQEDFLRRFQAGMNRVMENSVAEARNSVEAGFAPLLESFQNVAQTHREEVRGVYQKAGEEAAEQHREKLHGISNQWMLATVASLDQQSRAVVANIAATAEQQLRVTCEQVFAGVGDSLRERMREIVSGIDVKAKGHSA